MRYIVDNIIGLNNRQLSDIAVIQNLSYPSEVNIGQPFTVSYDCINLSGQVFTFFGYIIDNATAEQVVGSYWEQEILPGQTYQSVINFSGITQPFSGDAVLGHIEYAECEEITDPTECINAGCEWYNNSCHTPAPPQCSDYLNQTDCETNNCFWYNGSCHDTAPTCEAYLTALECINAGCEWYDGACHTPAGPACENLIDPTECINAGCFWYDGACHSTDKGELPPWLIPAAIAGAGVAAVIAIAVAAKPKRKRA